MTAVDPRNAPAVEVRGLVKDYSSRRGSHRALNGIDLTAAAGEVTAVLGPNGAGKTTTVRIVGTLVRPTAGTVTVAGVDAVRDPRRVRGLIGLSGQYAAVDNKLTGYENLRMLARLYGAGARDARARARQLLERFRLDDVGSRAVSTYSGGMRRRLDLAGALVARPPLIILDEPTTGLDPRSRNDMWDIVAELKAEGTAVLLTTQYLEEADRLADAIAVIDRGVVVARGTPTELKERVRPPAVDVRLRRPEDLRLASDLLPNMNFRVHRTTVAEGWFTVDGRHGSASMVDVLSRLHRTGIDVGDARINVPDLDDVFFESTGRSAEPMGAVEAVGAGEPT
ncbi:ATP-binding cassette domain-containing protein [Rhodococcoides corynebacterioides]|uniref:ATP-binding cassette domain-containing protein n=1 Tax=Rhodococcoides corynebacterioides TaxID=53972 RepID=A0ABS7P057_9NOCA|nr:ATP-binding cassette domain-containing protein [Rhodococcus corynebacterioides]MBY6365776.1 ATP-binding cassette domain-containing protein [Rhodococcus corynebacterioides]MBY6406507.1 ATP-binding cassette domain-containing protein [Rhodococcus corynebacterioides]